jgi:hypothetical protein
MRIGGSKTCAVVRRPQIRTDIPSAAISVKKLEIETETVSIVPLASKESVSVL